MSSEMAKENNKESNGTSSSPTEKGSEKGSEKDSEKAPEKVSEKKASAPSPSKSPPEESNPPEKAPSKSPPPPSSSPPPQQSPPPPAPPRSPPPSPSLSPPPAQTPPEAPPPDSSPPPAKASPPEPSQSSPPQLSPPPTPLSSPPAPLFSPPPPLLGESSPTPSHSNSPPPSPQAPSLPSPSLKFSPPPPHGHPSPPQSPSISPSSRSKPIPSPPKSNSQSKQPSSNSNTAQYVGITLATVFVLAFIAAVLFLLLKKKEKRGNIYALPPPKKSQMKGDVHYYVESPGFGYDNRNHLVAMQHLRSPSDPTQQQMNTGQIFFSYEQIVEITNEFSSENVIGEGGFGRVYKASMPDGRVGAVKLLKVGSGQGEREFRAEVDIISRVHHRHLVSLIGYCISEQQRVLIYEFVPNGNLDQHLHESEWNVLDWSKRTKIAIGAARGLAYLHEGCNPKIIHRDIKSSNILLDNAYEAQVADFGLARLTDDANTHVSTRVMGTFGYMAPEYATSGKLTDRSDVFSFGVVLLELITGKKPVDATQPVGDESLVEWARPLLLRAIQSGDFSELADPRLQRQYVDSEMFRMIEAAAACVRHSAPKRPRMVQIARALEIGDQLYDLSNGVKYGQSTIYDSGQYNEDLMRFKRMANGSFDDSEFDIYSAEYSSRDMPSGSTWIPQTPSADSQIKPVQE
ncbi:proline-rich receptor-like protein kinase PERK13 [Vicia villosa]|uniref:proline-rich receptor-like protein kinase PERK13 n=1 Tax=Vicia villosa TaxID=3911 RepID=UPI00273AAE9F|nr:proline-rich receptor-like protein kinase PERK13 [Vicia villosa]XP_058776437.1 proline-rich receptor-like protein kinase PERK13 [Vicia villosa]XP_058776439.1 proline-rich receptor-like protein kinase PERK13 [Vicia villosa]XP_058776440.1 proline-rich receptor-like protein kinase PERK13 [Vicia villosa]